MKIDAYIVVHGQGLAALVTAASLAAYSHVVLLCDDAATADDLNAGRLPFDEPGLAAALAAATRAKRLTITSVFPSLSTALAGSPAVNFLALHPEQDALLQKRLVDIAAFSGDVLLVNQVNYSVGATDALQAQLLTLRDDHKKPEAANTRLAAVSLPDFLRRGVALENFCRPDRIIIGSSDVWAEGVLRGILRAVTGNDVPVLVMPPRDAEFSKQAVNGMLATRLSYMNDMANVADVLGIDIENVRRGVGSDERIGSHFLHAGCGFGGTGFYQDLLSLKVTLEASGVASKLLDTALAVNEEQKELLFRKLWQHYRGNLAGRTVAIWGVAFKADTDRVDHAPSLQIVAALLAQNVTVQVHDPKALAQLRAHVGDHPRLVECADHYAAAEGADALLVLTEWQIYRAPDFKRLLAALHTPLLLDGRNLYDPATVRAHGFTYLGVGRR